MAQRECDTTLSKFRGKDDSDGEIAINPTRYRSPQFRDRRAKMYTTQYFGVIFLSRIFLLDNAPLIEIF